MRNHTERIEALESGSVKLVGTDFVKIFDSVIEILEDVKLFEKMEYLKNPFGDGQTSKLIYDVLLKSI